MKRMLPFTVVILLGSWFAQAAQACPPGLVLCCNNGVQTCTLHCFKPCVQGLTAAPASPAREAVPAAGASAAEPHRLTDRLAAFLASLWQEAGPPAASQAR